MLLKFEGRARRGKENGLIARSGISSGCEVESCESGKIRPSEGGQRDLVLPEHLPPKLHHPEQEITQIGWRRN